MIVVVMVRVVPWMSATLLFAAVDAARISSHHSTEGESHTTYGIARIFREGESCKGGELT